MGWELMKSPMNDRRSLKLRSLGHRPGIPARIVNAPKWRNASSLRFRIETGMF